MPITTVNTDKLVISLDNLTIGSNLSGVMTGIGRGLAFIFIPKENFTVTQIIFSAYSSNSLYNSDTLTVGIQHLDADGNPDNIYQTSATSNAPTFNNYLSEIKTVNVTPYSMIKGIPIFVVFKNNDINRTQSFNISISVDDYYYSRTKSYTFMNDTGVWQTRRQVVHSNQICFYSGSKYYGDACFSTVSSTSTARSSPNEIGTTFQLPANHPTLSLKGVQLESRSALANTVFELRIRNSSGTLLSSATVDGDFNTANNVPYFLFSTPVDFVAGIKYYIMLTGISGTPPLIISYINPSGQFMTDIRNGIVANLVEYNGTTFTETTNTTCRGYLMFDAIKYDQIEPPPIYSKPGGFSQF